MSTRIGALWKKTDTEGATYLTGNLKTEAGICIPAHASVQVSLRANKEKQDGDKRPDYYIEAWESKEASNG